MVHSPEGADLAYMAKAVSLERRVAPAAFLSFFKALGKRVVFTGYLLPARIPAVKEKDFVLVTRGGGSTSDSLLEAAIKAAPLIGRPMLVIAGPSTTPGRLEHFRRLAAASGGGAAVLFAFADMPGLMAKASACLSTAGGSVYELLALRKKMVLAPYCGSKGREHSDQLARAWLARDLAGAGVLLPGDLTPLRIAAALRRRLAAPLKISAAVKPGWFRGAARSAAVIEALCR
jgi:predicted glycosyltransferase